MYRQSQPKLIVRCLFWSIWYESHREKNGAPLMTLTDTQNHPQAKSGGGENPIHGTSIYRRNEWECMRSEGNLAEQRQTTDRWQIPDWVISVWRVFPAKPLTFSFRCHVEINCQPFAIIKGMRNLHVNSGGSIVGTWPRMDLLILFHIAHSSVKTL